MAKLSLDMSNTDSRSPIPVGEYLCHVFNVEIKKTRAGGDIVVLTLRVADGEHKGRQLWHNLPIMAQTMWKVREALEAAGYEVPKSVMEVDFDDMLGRKVVAIVGMGIDARDGSERSELKSLKPAPEDSVSGAQKDKDVPF